MRNARVELGYYRDSQHPQKPVIVLISWLAGDQRISEEERREFDRLTEERAHRLFELAFAERPPNFRVLRRALGEERRRGPAVDGLRLTRVMTPLQLAAHLRCPRPDAFASSGFPGFCQISFWWDGTEHRLPSEHRPRRYTDMLRDLEMEAAECAEGD